MPKQLLTKKEVMDYYELSKYTTNEILAKVPYIQPKENSRKLWHIDDIEKYFKQARKIDPCISLPRNYSKEKVKATILTLPSEEIGLDEALKLI